MGPLAHTAIHKFYVEAMRRLAEQLSADRIDPDEISRADDSLALRSA